MIKVLNLYAGIGGNRKLWEDVEVTAVEINPSIADVYKHFFPNDLVIKDDAHSYLLKHFEEFDFIWSSPPCQTHSLVRQNTCIPRGQCIPCYPDMRLYEEILFLKHNFPGKWVVENVAAYYEPLIKPWLVQRHWFWTNFHLSAHPFDADNIGRGTIDEWQKRLGFDLTGFKLGHRKDQVLKNCVQPEMGKYVFDCAFKGKQLKLVGGDR